MPHKRRQEKVDVRILGEPPSHGGRPGPGARQEKTDVRLLGEPPRPGHRIRPFVSVGRRAKARLSPFARRRHR